MSRYRSGYDVSFGPGPMTPGVKWIIAANVIVFLLQTVQRGLFEVRFGLMPAAVIEELWIWQVVTYMFLHGGLGHLLFNMLAIWMFGVAIERTWGTAEFLKYYFLTGVGAAITTIVVSLLPIPAFAQTYAIPTIGASGAIYGLFMAFGRMFPTQRILVSFLFPIEARYFVWIMGAITLYLSITDTRGGVAHLAHLGGLLFGYWYLTRSSGGLLGELKYRYLKWKMSRVRKRFDIHQGGRGGWGPH